MYGLQQRKNKEFNNKVINIFNYLTINGKSFPRYISK